MTLNDGYIPGFKPEEIRHENDYFIKELILTSYNGQQYDLINHKDSLSFTESIFEPCIYGELSVRDGIDYMYWMPIIGEETLKVTFTKPDEAAGPGGGAFLPDISVSFRVYKVTTRQTQTQHIQTYTLHLISEEYIKNIKKKVFKGWTNTKYSDMVQDVYEKYMKVEKPIVVEPTQYEYNFCACNISPIEFFNQVGSKSISEEGNGSAYVFYEDKEQFNFTTIGKLFTQPVSQKYTRRVANLTETNKDGSFISSSKLIQGDVFRSEHYYWNNSFDIIKNLETGMYGQRMFTIDIIRQKFETIDFNLDKEFETFKHLDDKKFFTNEQNSPVNEAETSLTKLVLTTKDHDVLDHLKELDPSMKPNRVELFHLHRTSQMNQISQNVLGMMVPGDPRRKVGQVIEFDIPKITGDLYNDEGFGGGRREEEPNEYYTGKYLIVSLKHVISENGYRMMMELVKEGFAKDIEHIDPRPRFENIV